MAVSTNMSSDANFIRLYLHLIKISSYFNCFSEFVKINKARVSLLYNGMMLFL